MSRAWGCGSAGKAGFSQCFIPKTDMVGGENGLWQVELHIQAAVHKNTQINAKKIVDVQKAIDFENCS